MHAARHRTRRRRLRGRRRREALHGQPSHPGSHGARAEHEPWRTATSPLRPRAAATTTVRSRSRSARTPATRANSMPTARRCIWITPDNARSRPTRSRPTTTTPASDPTRSRSASSPGRFRSAATAPASAEVGGSYTPSTQAGGSSTPVSLSVSPSNVCSLTNGVVSFDHHGTCTVQGGATRRPRLHRRGPGHSNRSPSAPLPRRST